MKELNKINTFGYITQGLDLTLRARTINNEIICLEVSPEGTTGTYQGEPVELPEILKKADRMIYVIQILKKSKLTLENGIVSITPIDVSLCSGDRGQADCLIDACGIEGCNLKICRPHLAYATNSKEKTNPENADSAEIYCPFIL